MAWFYDFCTIFFFFSSRRRHTRCALVTGVQTCALPISSCCARYLSASFIPMRTESTLLAWSDVSPADDGTTIADLFRVLRRRRRTIVLVTVLLTGATAAFASQLDARYSAVASLVERK